MNENGDFLQSKPINPIAIFFTTTKIGYYLFLWFNMFFGMLAAVLSLIPRLIMRLFGYKADIILWLDTNVPLYDWEEIHPKTYDDEC